MKTLIITNPQAGGAEDQPALRRALAQLPHAHLVETEAAGHAERLASRAAAEGIDVVVAAGGDGTLNEVLNGLVDHLDRVCLGVLPIGTGNDFVRSIGIPADIEQAVEVLVAGRRHRVDVARARLDDHSRLFLNMSAGGFSQEVGELLDSEVKSRWGALAYLRSAAGALPDLAPHRVRIDLEGPDPDGGERLELDVFLVAVANARYVASGIPAAPQARIDDGLLDLIVFPEMPLGQLAVLVPQALIGRHVEGGRVVFRRVRRLHVEAEPPLAFNADGEQLPAGPTTFEVLPRALEMIVGRLEQEDDDNGKGGGPAGDGRAVA